MVNNYPHLIIEQTPIEGKAEIFVQISFKLDKPYNRKIKNGTVEVSNIGFEHTIDNNKLEEMLPLILQHVEEFRIKKLENGNTHK